MEVKNNGKRIECCERMKLLLDNQCTLVNTDSQILTKLRSVLTIKNPAYQEALRQGRWTGNLQKELVFWSETDGGFHFPRGFMRQALDITSKSIAFQDDRRTLPEVDFKFSGKLRSYQQQAVDDILRKDFGVLSAATGSGKTVVALKIIAARRQPTLILVHNKSLLYQWRDRIAEFLGVGSGLIGDGKYKIKPVTVGIINTVCKHLELPQYFGQVICDETHKIPCVMAGSIIRACDCRYMLGLSATPYRRDRLTKLIHWFIGPLVHQIDSSNLQNIGAVLVPKIITRQTDFHYKFKNDYSKMLSTLTQDEMRNIQIAQDILREARIFQGTTILVVSDRVKHCLALANLLDNSLSVRILTGQTKAVERISIVEQVRTGKVNVLISTIQLIGEGFDCPGLSTLFMATPISFKGRMIQTIGRILRPADGKKPRVYDYQDPVGPLFASAKARGRVYREQKWIVNA